MTVICVTTGRSEPAHDVGLAYALAAELGAVYLRRRCRTNRRLIADAGLDGLVVCGDDGVVWHDPQGGTFRFHPNMAVTRVRSRRRADPPDPLVRAARLEPGDRVLDGTLGLGADAIVASDAVGPAGVVVGLEASPVVAALVRWGLATWEHRCSPAMRRIRVVQGDHREHLLERSWLARAGWDVILFDPMFSEPVAGSSGIAGLRALACDEPVSAETIGLARALVSKAVVLKTRRGDPHVVALGPDWWTGGRGRVVYAGFGPAGAPGGGDDGLG
ncbi:MAG: class I SAM-dependent methyltransferase [Armatimonadetes bacterium]|nr:class I SAM-dependent methyltransferase [Armatimonadota bacterium]